MEFDLGYRALGRKLSGGYNMPQQSGARATEVSPSSPSCDTGWSRCIKAAAAVVKRANGHQEVAVVDGCDIHTLWVVDPLLYSSTTGSTAADSLLGCLVLLCAVVAGAYECLE